MAMFAAQDQDKKKKKKGQRFKRKPQRKKEPPKEEVQDYDQPVILDVEGFAKLDTEGKLTKLFLHLGMHLADVRRTCKHNKMRIDKIYKSVSGTSMADVLAYFNKYDTDQSGSIDADEFEILLEDCEIQLTKKEFGLLFHHLDMSGDGNICVREFEQMCKSIADDNPDNDVHEVIKMAIIKEVELVRRGIEEKSRGGDTGADHHVWDVSPFAPYDAWPPAGTCGWVIMNLHFTMEDEGYSYLSMLMFLTVMFAIVLSTISFVLETFDEWARWIGWSWIEWCVSLAFSGELCLRLIACRNALRFWEWETWYMSDFMNVIDLVAIVPFYMQLYLQIDGAGLRVIRVVRIMRIARLRRFKMVQMNFEILANALRNSYEQSGLIVSALIFIEVLICSSVVYITEKGDKYPHCPTASDFNSNKVEWCASAGLVGAKCVYREICSTSLALANDPVNIIKDMCSWNTFDECSGKHFRSDGSATPFHSIPHTMWWTVTTITTTGYGEMYPVTGFGQMFGAFTMITGVVCVSIFVVVIAGNFNEANRAMQEKIRLFHKVGDGNDTHGDDEEDAYSPKETTTKPDSLRASSEV